MTILMLSKYFYPHIGGVETHVEKVSRELIKLGHKVTVVTMKHDQKKGKKEKKKKKKKKKKYNIYIKKKKK